MANEGGPTAPTGTYTSRPIEIRQKVEMLDCWERARNYPPEFCCQIHGDNSSHDTSDCIVLRKEFVMLNPEFMEYRRRRLGAATPIGGRGSARGMYYLSLIHI